MEVEQHWSNQGMEVVWLSNHQQALCHGQQVVSHGQQAILMATWYEVSGLLMIIDGRVILKWHY
jgi:hypothetical protein